MTDHRDNLYLELEAERNRQEKLWGIQHHGRYQWSAILGEEYGEACKAANEMDMKGLRAELIEVAAVCLAWLEDLDFQPEPRHWDEEKRLWVKSG